MLVPPGVDVRFVTSPAQVGPSLAATIESDLINTFVVAVAVQAEPLAFTVTVYTPLLAKVTGATDVFWFVLVNEEGPDHEYDVGAAEPEGVAVSTTTAPRHAGPSLLAVRPRSFTTTFVVAIATQLEPVAVTITV